MLFQGIHNPPLLFLEDGELQFPARLRGSDVLVCSHWFWMEPSFQGNDTRV